MGYPRKLRFSEDDTLVALTLRVPERLRARLRVLARLNGLRISEYCGELLRAETAGVGKRVDKFITQVREDFGSGEQGSSTTRQARRQGAGKKTHRGTAQGYRPQSR